MLVGQNPRRRVRFEVNGWNDIGSVTKMQAPSDTARTRNNDDNKTHLNYFTCTLGEAAIWNAQHPHPFTTVNHLIDEQADELRQRPAVNFPGGCLSEDGREMKSGT